MMNLKILLPLLALNVGCNNHQPEARIPDRPVQQSEESRLDEAQAVEYLDWRKAKINNLLPLEATENKVNLVLSQADSMVASTMEDVCGSFHDRDFKYAYFQNIEFEKYQDTLVFRSLDFENNKNNFLQVNDFVLNASSNLEQLKKYFPKAVKAVYSIHNSEGLEAIQLEVTGSFADDKWILFFKRKNLIRIEYYIPC